MKTGVRFLNTKSSHVGSCFFFSGDGMSPLKSSVKAETICMSSIRPVVFNVPADAIREPEKETAGKGKCYFIFNSPTFINKIN